ncbi:MAG: clan AA aspartic protease [Sandarakinorhabdus sp.]
MGIIFRNIRLANFGRDDLEEIDANALVDSGAAELCIPQHIANQLRLKQIEEREVRIANGDRVLVPYVGGVRVEVFGRQTVTSAIVIGDQVLLGAIPMEAMDLVIHPRSLTLIPNPDSPNVPASLAMGVRGG